MGLAGTAVSAISFVTCWLWPAGASHVKTVDEAAPEALSYFVTSAVIIAAAIVTYDIFFRQPFVKQHLQPEGEPSSKAAPCPQTPVVLIIVHRWGVVSDSPCHMLVREEKADAITRP